MAVTEHDLDEEHDDDLDPSDDTPLVRKLRDQLKSANKRAKRADELESENRSLKGEQMLAKAGLTKGGEPVSLTDRQKQTLLREVGDEVTPEALHDAAVELGWAERQADPVEQEIEQQERISQAARGAGAKGGEGEITPAQVATWSQDRIRAFRDVHPTEFEQLKRGESVKGITA